METVKGNKLVYLYREYEKREAETGSLLAFVTDNNRSVSKDADTTATKDGVIRTPGEAEIEISSTSILKKGDEKIAQYEAAMMHNKLIECWEANLEDPGQGENKFKGRYYQGYFTSFDVNSNADGYVEIELTFAANGTGATGEVTVTKEQQDEAAYAFADTAIVTTGG